MQELAFPIKLISLKWPLLEGIYRVLEATALLSIVFNMEFLIIIMIMA